MWPLYRSPHIHCVQETLSHGRVYWRVLRNKSLLLGLRKPPGVQTQRKRNKLSKERTPFFCLRFHICLRIFLHFLSISSLSSTYRTNMVLLQRFATIIIRADSGNWLLGALESNYAIRLKVFFSNLGTKKSKKMRPYCWQVIKRLEILFFDMFLLKIELFLNNGKHCKKGQRANKRICQKRFRRINQEFCKNEYTTKIFSCF